MNYKIVIIDEAKIDCKETLFRYKNVDPKLAKRFHLSFKESLAIIKTILSSRQAINLQEIAN